MVTNPRNIDPLSGIESREWVGKFDGDDLVLFPLLNQPDWLTLLFVLVFFSWGLSVKKPDSMIDPRHAG